MAFDVTAAHHALNQTSLCSSNLSIVNSSGETMGLTSQKVLIVDNGNRFLVTETQIVTRLNEFSLWMFLIQAG